MRYVVCVACCLALLSGGLLSQKTDDIVMIGKGFLTAEQYRALTAVERNAYVMGYINGLFSSPLLQANPEKVERLEGCLKGMTETQLRAILDKYLQDRPEVWHHQLDVGSYNSLIGFCPALVPSK